MRILLLIPVCLITFLSNAQITKKIYNTKIDQSKDVTINGGKTTILKVDTIFIGKLIINIQRNGISFAGSTRTIDSIGTYTTTYYFTPIDNSHSFEFNLQLKFDKPFKPMYYISPYKIESIGASTMQFSLDYDNKDFKSISAKGTCTSTSGIKIIVESKTPLFASIYGIDGRIK